jgi:hypothetical protein
MSTFRSGRRATAGLAALVAVVLLAGCGSDDAEDADEKPSTWKVSGAPIDTTLPLWSSGSTVHLGDESDIDTGSQLEEYVVAGDGVYFVADRHLMHATAAEVEDTGAYADPETLRASPDGRYLAFVDRVTGDKDEFDTPVAEAVVVDLDAGKEIVRSDDDMGGLDTDLKDLYEDAGDPDILGITDDTVWVFTPGDVQVYDLATAKRSTLPDDTIGDKTQPWYAERYRGDGFWNPGHTWAIATTQSRDRLVSADGTRVSPQTGSPTWSLFRWLDDSTALGFAFDAEPRADGTIDPDAARTLITCTVPEGACTPIPASTGEDVVLPTPSLL